MDDGDREKRRDVIEFVGRERELRELLGSLDRARAGRGAVILLGGEPGVGKSRLADEFAGLARSAGTHVLWGGCWEGGGAPAYWPWIQALRTLLRLSDAAVASKQMGPGAADIAQMLPELRATLGEERTAGTDPDSARFRLFDSAASFLRNAARSRELLIVLDDIQAADAPSVLFLRFLASQVGDMRIVVLVTYRDVELTPGDPVATALGELQREPITSVVVLRGLEPDAMSRLIEQTTGFVPPAGLVSALWRETKGNPLFVGEALRLLASEGRIDEAGDLESLRLTVPAGVREVITRRIGRLTDPTAEALGLAAAFGPEFGVEALRRVGDYAGDELVELLNEGTRAGLVVEVAGTQDRFRFSHDLVRETLYAELAPPRRVRLHRRIAETLESLYMPSSETGLAELAHHFFEAAQGWNPEGGPGYARDAADRATHYASQAAERASKSLGYEEAARLYRIALQAHASGSVPDEATRAELLLSLGDVRARAGDLAGASAAFLEVASIARRTGDARQLARAALGYGGRFVWARAGRDALTVRLLQDALVMLGGSDDHLRARLLTRLACAWRDAPEQREQSAALSRQAVEIARGLEDPSTLAYVLVGRFYAIWWPENPEDRLEIARELLRVAEAAGDAERTIDGYMTLYVALTELCRMTEARAATDAAERVASELRQPAQLWMIQAVRATTALIEGDYRRAEKLIDRESRPMYPTTRVRDDVSEARMHRFLLERERGQLSGLEAEVRASADEFPWYPMHRAALASLLVELDRFPEAQAVFEDLAREDFRAMYPDNEWLLGMALTSEACFRLDHRVAAESLYAQLAPFAGRHAIGHAEGSLGAVDRYLGLLAATLGRRDDAIRHMEAALDLNERMAAWPWVAHTQYDLSCLLDDSGALVERQRAAHMRRLAAETARRLGMTALETLLASRPGATADGVNIERPDQPSAIFRREGEYWAIAFGGEAFRIRDAKGLRYLAQLLARPGTEVLALDLVRKDAGHAPSGAPSGRGLASPGDAGELLDAEAKAAYRRRMLELEDELRGSEAWNDVERTERIRREKEFLTEEIARAVGLGGRDRVAASATERARISATRAIRLAIARISRSSTKLGGHLATTIRTGTYCSYHPDPRIETSWQL